MKKILGCLFLGLTVLLNAAGTSAKLEICQYKDNKKAALALTFDDASLDHYYMAAPALAEYGFKGTFYTIVKRVSEKPLTMKDEVKGRYKYMNWGQIKELADKGHDIGNHSMTHYQLVKAKDKAALEYEIITPIKIIEEKVGVKPLTFCYPGNSRNAEIVELTHENHIGSTNMGRHFYGGEKFDLDKHKQWLKNSIAQGKEHIAMIHGIVPNGGGWKPFKDLETFKLMLANIKEVENDMWVATYADLCKYRRVRETAKLVEDAPNSFSITSDFAYDMPLTVKVSPCPKQVTQNDKELKVVKSAGCGYIQVLPEMGKFKLIY